jgi:hypothetical protein
VNNESAVRYDIDAYVEGWTCECIKEDLDEIDDD